MTRIVLIYYDFKIIFQLRFISVYHIHLCHQHSIVFYSFEYQ
jgi:hypothetical protein